MKTRTPIRERDTLEFKYTRTYSHPNGTRNYRVVTRRRPKEGLAAFKRRHKRKVERALHPSRISPGAGAVEIHPA